MRTSGPRYQLVVAFKNPMLLCGMETHCMVRALNNKQDFLPRAGAFAFLDGELFVRARLGMAMAMPRLRNTFAVNPPDTEYGFSGLQQHIRKMYDTGDEDIEIGSLFSSGLRPVQVVETIRRWNDDRRLPRRGEPVAGHHLLIQFHLFQ